MKERPMVSTSDAALQSGLFAIKESLHELQTALPEVPPECFEIAVLVLDDALHDATLWQPLPDEY